MTSKRTRGSRGGERGSGKSSITGKAAKESSAKVAPAPKKALGDEPQQSKQGKAVHPFNPLFKRKRKNYSIGGDPQPKRDLTRYVKWPRYIRLQRQRALLYKRLKVPPPINMFNHGLDKQTASQVLKFFSKYKPETRRERKARLLKHAEKRVAGVQTAPDSQRLRVHFGARPVTAMVESKRAKLVLIAGDVDPIEVVLFMPFLCRKMGVPYAIIRSKSRLGQIVGKKKTSCMCLNNVYPEDKPQLTKLSESIKANYLDRFDEIRRQWGGGILSKKAREREEELKRRQEEEAAKRFGEK